MKTGSLEIANSLAWIFSRGQANGVTSTPSSTKTFKQRAWQHVGACIRCTPILRLLLLVILDRRFILIYFVLYLNIDLRAQGAFATFEGRRALGTSLVDIIQRY